MTETMDPLEKLWSEILSGNEKIIRTVFERLDPDGRKTVLDHLRKMASEEGWQIQQRQSAQVALNVLAAKAE